MKAVELGVDAIELDLCISGDNRVVVSHDPYMQAGMCATPDGKVLTKSDEAKYLLFTMKYADIVRFDCGIPVAGFPGQQSVRAEKPLLEDVFCSVERYCEKMRRHSGMIYNLEVKSGEDGDGVMHPPPDEYAELVTAVIEKSGMVSRVRLQSFDTRILKEAKNISSSLSLGLLVGRGQNPETELKGLGFLPDYLNPYFSMVSPALVAMLHGQGIGIVPWTVNSPEAMKALAGMGVDGVITDYPDLAQEVLRG